MERRRKPLPRRPAYCAPFSSGCPPAKKRKRLGTTSQEPWAGAAGGDEGGVDRISALPDELLGEIISLLPTKDGACTQILASRWRHLWLSAPLNLDCRDLATAVDLAVVKYHRVYNNALSAVAHIFSLHQGPGRRFRVKGYRLPLAVAATAAALDCWLVAPALDGLQVLECWVYYKNCRPLGPLPASAYRFSPTLRVATFGGCHLPDDHIAQGLHFPNLKHLSLEYVSTSEHSLHSLIAGCPVLECLMIYTSFGFRRLRINSPTLTFICVQDQVQNCKGFTPLHSGEKNLWHRKHQDLLTCLDIRLRTVVLETYLGSWSQVNFAKFFVLNARVLESMTFHVEASLYGEEFLAEQRGKLQLGNKASRDAQFHFTTATSLEAVWESKHLSDLNLNDPFLCRC
ncbi:hypothetical protein VPH35_087973 [Triticum aestivum]